ncbi:hypothetical protein C0033_20805 [Clostridium sp. chh4-2]|uniref:GntR family transcriptional regulator n=1 Tax=Clostridium sp. chh4-2 TaxID=2067550 RepID=UPI000CCFA287|nr:GntR family transcriptional regulator [Clostridium sp. chh4-2]PNV60099.1 hypothetical protein C0033_20805 [Clostridium sp. chh4-2]
MIGDKIYADAMKKSASDYVTEVLRKSIITRELVQGERLVEIDIAKKLNVSITPVRHAFMQLSKEGLIDIYPYKGSYVTKITPKLVSDMSACRIMLEPEAALYAYDHFMESDPDYLMNIIEEARKSYQKTDDLYELLQNDVRLHRSIIEFSDNKVMMDMWEAINFRVLLLQSYAKEGKEFRISYFVNNHLEIAEALALKKGKEAFSKAVKDHMIHSRETDFTVLFKSIE